MGELWHDFNAFTIDVNDYPTMAFRPQPHVKVGFESRYYPISESGDKRAYKLKSLNSRFDKPLLCMHDFEEFLSRTYRAVRTDIASDEVMQEALKTYKKRKPSPCPKIWINQETD